MSHTRPCPKRATLARSFNLPIRTLPAISFSYPVAGSALAAKEAQESVQLLGVLQGSGPSELWASADPQHCAGPATASFAWTRRKSAGHAKADVLLVSCPLLRRSRPFFGAGCAIPTTKEGIVVPVRAIDISLVSMARSERCWFGTGTALPVRRPMFAVKGEGAASATRRMRLWDPVRIVARKGTFGSGAQAAGVPVDASTAAPGGIAWTCVSLDPTSAGATMRRTARPGRID